MSEEIFPPDAVDDIPLKPLRQASSSSTPNSLFAQAEKAYLDNKLREQELIEAQNNNELRKTIPNQLWILTVCWLIAVLVITIFSGIDHDAFPGFFFFKFDSTVLIALITSTTASVLGLFTILLNYLYPNNSRQASKANLAKSDQNSHGLKI